MRILCSFYSLWEKLNNPDFNSVEFHRIKIARYHTIGLVRLLHDLHGLPREKGYLTLEIAPPLCECSTGCTQ